MNFVVVFSSLSFFSRFYRVLPSFFVRLLGGGDEDAPPAFAFAARQRFVSFPSNLRIALDPQNRPPTLVLRNVEAKDE